MNKDEFSTKIEFLRDVFPHLSEGTIMARLQSAPHSERSTDALVSYFLSSEEKENAPPQNQISDNILNNSQTINKDTPITQDKVPTKSKYVIKDDDEEDVADTSNEHIEEVSHDPVNYSDATGKVEKSAEQVEQEDNDLKYAQQLYEQEVKQLETENRPPPNPTYISPYHIPPKPSASASTSTSTKNTISKPTTATTTSTSNKRVVPPIDKETEKRARSEAADQLKDIRKMHEDQWKSKGGKAAPGNVNKSGGGFNAGYYNQLKEIREKHNRSWHDTKATEKRVWTIGDIEAATKQAHVDSGKLINGDTPAVRIGKEALELTNKFRKENKLPPLAWHAALCTIGAVHSKNMAEHKVPFGHDGFQERVKQYPMSHRSAAENVAMSKGIDAVALTAVDGWIHSPGHRKNLLSHSEYCGIGCYQGTDGSWYLTQLFAG